MTLEVIVDEYGDERDSEFLELRQLVRDFVNSCVVRYYTVEELADAELTDE